MTTPTSWSRTSTTSSSAAWCSRFSAALYYWAPALSGRALSETLGALGLRDDVPGSQHRLPPDAPASGMRDAAPREHLSRRDGLADAEPDLDRRRLHARGRDARGPLRPRARISALVDAARRQRLECRHAGVAAAAPLRPAQHSAHREPRPALATAEPAHEVDDGAHYLPSTDRRARNDHHLAHRCRAAVPAACPGRAGRRFSPRSSPPPFSCSSTVKLVTVALACGVIAIAFILVWTWGSDPNPWPTPTSAVASGRRPTSPARCRTRGGPWSFVRWSPARSTWRSVFSDIYVWTVAPQVWPAVGTRELPHPRWPTHRLAARARRDVHVRCGQDAPSV